VPARTIPPGATPPNPAYGRAAAAPPGRPPRARRDLVARVIDEDTGLCSSACRKKFDKGWKTRTWTLRPPALSYRAIWLACARELLPSRPGSLPARTVAALSLEPADGPAAFLRAYAAACRRGEPRFPLLFDRVWRAAPAPPASRSRGGGICLGGDGAVLVRAAGGWAARAVRDLAPGDVVACAGGGSAAVVATWRLDAPAGGLRMCLVRGVWLTPDHPVRAPCGRWCRADALAPAAPRRAAAVHNLAVAGLRPILVAPPPAAAAAAADADAGARLEREGGVACATLGQAVPGLADPLWGSPSIVAWMSRQPGWPALRRVPPPPAPRPPSRRGARPPGRAASVVARG
jgi:hypothetical protein